MAQLFTWNGKCRVFVGPLFLTVLLLSSGCAETEKSLPVPYSVTFEATTDVNLDSQRRPAPVALQLFRLRSGDAFERAGFFSLQNKPADALGGDLVGADRLILRPGESRTLRYTADESVRELGVVAGFRNLEKMRWKVVIALPSPRQTNLWKFWQLPPSEMHFVVVLRKDGVDTQTGNR